MATCESCSGASTTTELRPERIDQPPGAVNVAPAGVVRWVADDSRSEVDCGAANAIDAANSAASATKYIAQRPRARGAIQNRNSQLGRAGRGPFCACSLKEGREQRIFMAFDYSSQGPNPALSFY